MTYISKTNSSLAYLEEWPMCLEFVHVHSLKRWTDFESKQGCDVRIKNLRDELDAKLKLALKHINIWAMHSHNTDGGLTLKRLFKVDAPSALEANHARSRTKKFFVQNHTLTSPKNMKLWECVRLRVGVMAACSDFSDFIFQKSALVW